MKTPYIPHYFGEEVTRRFRKPGNWVTAGVASSIAWPQEDVCVVYAGDEFILRGYLREGKESPPCISLQCDRIGVEEGLSRIYRFTSVLGWFMRGYVDVSGYISGSPGLYGDRRNVFVTSGSSKRAFNCNHMPVLVNDEQRKALAFWREGLRLKGVHDSYAFLSFYKVLESNFSDWRNKVAWVDKVAGGLSKEAKARTADIQASGVDLNTHLYKSGRCAVAHASFGGSIVDPDIPEDRRRLSADLVVMQALAKKFIADELGIPDEMAVYKSRDHLTPWHSILPAGALSVLKGGGGTPDAAVFEGMNVDVCLWPHGPMPSLEKMTFFFARAWNGVVTLYALNKRRNFYLVFHLDFANGKIHTDLESASGLSYGPPAIEDEVHSTHFYFHSVIGNAIVELRVNGLEPVDCEVVIPTNIIPQAPGKMADEAVARFRRVVAAKSPEGAEPPVE